MESETEPSAEVRAPDDPERLPPEIEEVLVRALESGTRLCFGPAFFASHLGAFVRDCCPKPEEALPVVELHLMSGEVIDVCHVIGLARQWAAVAAFDEREGAAPGAMHTELVPYAAILRVTIRPAPRGGKRVGFFRDAMPAIVSDERLPASPESLLSRSAAPSRTTL